MKRRGMAMFTLVLAACSELIGPQRLDPYEYREFVTTAPGTTDTLVFHWPRASLPVRYWVAPQSPLAPYVPVALDRWRNAFLYDEFHGELVDDSAHADVIVVNARRPLTNKDIAKVSLHAWAPQCNGETTFDYHDVGGRREIVLPIYVYVAPRFDQDSPDRQKCYRITVTHEIGHTIGLLEESPNVSDVMFADPVLDGLSDKDRVTAETVYHVPATLFVGARP